MVVFHTAAARPVIRLSTVGRRSFPVAASMFWNTLPDDIQSAPSVSAFRRLRKTFLFHNSFPDVYSVDPLTAFPWSIRNMLRLF